MKRLSLLSLAVLLATVAAGPLSPLPREPCFIADSTNDLATALLQGNGESRENVVYSPLGVNTLLAIFGEGARSETYDELAKTLHLPADRQEARQAYQKILKGLSNPYKANKPEMRNWFYIYKNNTVNEELQGILKEFYLAEVKSVDRPEDVFAESDASEEGKKKVKVPAGLQGKPTEHLIDVDKQVEAIIDSASSPHKSDGEEAASGQQPALFDPAKKEENKQSEDKILEGLPGSSNSNEKTQLSEEQKNQLKKEEEVKLEVEEHKNQVKKEVKPVVEGQNQFKTEEEVEATVEEQKPQEAEKKPDEEVTGNKVMKVSTVNKVKVTEGEKENEIKVQEEEKKEEMMVAMQRSESEGASANDIDSNLNAMTDSAVKISGKDAKSRMIVFNGLYFIGNYENEFVKVRADDSRPFYKKNNEKTYVHTLHSEGLFKTAEIDELSSRAVEIQYKEGRYSLLLVLPNEQDGLDQVVEKLSAYPVSKIQDQLSEKLLDICLPTFEATTVAKTLNALKESKMVTLNKLFSQESADLSGISNERGLFVEELVQLVTFKVDVNETEANFLSASVASSRSDVEKVRFNHPFLIYLLDNQHGIIVVNGKVIDPTPVMDEDFTVSSLRNTMRRLLL